MGYALHDAEQAALAVASARAAYARGDAEALDDALDAAQLALDSIAYAAPFGLDQVSPGLIAERLELMRLELNALH